MNIYTNHEMTAKEIPATYAATAAKFIMEERRSNMTIWPNTACLKAYKGKKVTIEKINELTDQIIADTPH